MSISNARALKNRGAQPMTINFKVNDCSVTVTMDKDDFMSSRESCAEILYRAVEQTKHKLQFEIERMESRLHQLTENF